MLKIVLLIVGLAAYGAYSLYSSYVPRTAATETDEAPSRGLLGAGVALGAKITGLATKDMPANGCNNEALSTTNLASLLDQLPVGQATVLRQLASASSSVSSFATWYNGEEGIGLCIPSQNLLVLLPDTMSGLLLAPK